MDTGTEEATVLYTDGERLWQEQRAKWRGDTSAPLRPQPLQDPEVLLKDFVSNYDNFQRRVPLTQLVHLLAELWETDAEGQPTYN